MLIWHIIHSKYMHIKHITQDRVKLFWAKNNIIFSIYLYSSILKVLVYLNIPLLVYLDQNDQK